MIKVSQVFQIDGEALFSALSRATGSKRVYLNKAYDFYISKKDSDYGKLSESQLNWLEQIQNEFPKGK